MSDFNVFKSRLKTTMKFRKSTVELANFATIPDDEQQPEEEEPLPEPGEPSPANLDPSDLSAYVFRVQAERAHAKPSS